MYKYFEIYLLASQTLAEIKLFHHVRNTYVHSSMEYRDGMKPQKRAGKSSLYDQIYYIRKKVSSEFPVSREIVNDMRYRLYGRVQRVIQSEEITFLIIVAF